MSFGIGAVKKLAQPVRLAQTVAQTAAKAAMPVPALAVDRAAQAMMAKLTDGFERSSSISPATSSSAPAAPAKKKKKKKHGLFGKIGGFLKKALPMVKSIASMIPGLGAVVKPLELASSFLSH